jgi:hypothetical protein
MALSKKYILRLLGGWALFGGASFLFSDRYIGGAATLFFLIAIASWSIFPLLHFVVAAVAARKFRQDPSAVVSFALVSSILLLLFVLLASGLFNYV